MARRRKPNQRKHTKRSDLVRPCSSGKRSYKNRGEAEKQAKRKGLLVYTCKECGDLHLAHPVSRRQRQVRAYRGEAI